jgi:hypothetical protein
LKKNKSKSARRKLAIHNNIMERSRLGGVRAIRRPVAEESLEVVQNLIEVLKPELKNIARLFVPESIHITVVGYSRYSKQYKESGLKTREIADKVPSSKQVIDKVLLGRLGVYGGGTSRAPKLAAGVVSSVLMDEALEFEEQFQVEGYPLFADYNADNQLGDFDSHLSLASINSDHVRDFHDPRLPKRLSGIAQLIKADPIFIKLDPVVFVPCD